MTFALQSSRRAEADLAVIFDWIAQRSPAGARRWLEAFESAMQHLRDQADRCSRATEADEFGIDLRQWVFRTRRGRPYRLLFVIRHDVVHLASLRGPGQDDVAWDDLDLPD